MTPVYIPYFPVSLVGPGRFLVVPRFNASVVLSLTGRSKPVEIPFDAHAWLPVSEGQTAHVVSGYPEVVQFARRLDAELEPVAFLEDLASTKEAS